MTIVALVQSLIHGMQTDNAVQAHDLPFRKLISRHQDEPARASRSQAVANVDLSMGNAHRAIIHDKLPINRISHFFVIANPSKVTTVPRANPATPPIPSNKAAASFFSSKWH